MTEDASGDTSQLASDQVSTATATRTLTAAGFRITGFQRSISHIEYSCERSDAFGVALQYVFLIFDTDQASDSIVSSRSSFARENGAAVVVVSKQAGGNALSWDDFLATLGGAVPNWRALTDDFFDVLRDSGRNIAVDGYEELPWRVFEDAVADALEFIFGRRVRRLGGRRRGLRVPDSLASTPDGAVIVVDAKSSASPFDVTNDELRPLKEYVLNQKIRQTGSQPVTSALLVGDAFKQDETRLRELSNDFIAEVGVPLTFLTSDDVGQAVKLLAPDIRMRNKLRWRRWLCVGGLARQSVLEQELVRAKDEAVVRD